MRFFMELAYRGAPFHGWQVQPHQVSVQSTLEQALSTLLRSTTALTGAGRTDAGVNARHMVAHFDVAAPGEAPDVNMSGAKPGKAPDVCSPTFIRSLNSLIGRDIAVYSISPVADDAHARFDACARTYRYFVETRKNPFVGALAWQAPPRLDFDAMNEAAALLTTLTDFTSFAKLHSDARTNICRLDSARWVQTGAHSWYFEITADRFLRNMVRAVVGTLVDVGRGKMRPQDILAVAGEKDRCAAGTSMPAEALFLWRVDYPKEIFTSAMES